MPSKNCSSTTGSPSFSLLNYFSLSYSSLIFAAYSVAKSAGDADYLTQVCKDIAQSMMTTAGQSACAAQEDVLQCCDRLYIDNKITDNQLLYLRHLVLIRDEDVAQMYDEFQENFDVTRLMIGLLRLANLQLKMNDEHGNSSSATHTATTTQTGTKESEPPRHQKAIKKQQEEIANSYKQQKKKKVESLSTTTTTQSKKRHTEETKSRSKKENPYRKKSNERNSSLTPPQPTPTAPAPAPPPPPSKNLNHVNEQKIMFNTLNGIIALMIRTEDITPIEAVLLNHMVTSENEFIFAAYEIFQSDGNLVELQDTLTRCAKIELKKRGLDQQKPGGGGGKKTSPPGNKNSSKAMSNNKTAVNTQQRNQRSRQKPSNQNVSEADDENGLSSSDDNSQPLPNINTNTSSENSTPQNDIEVPDSCDSPSQLNRLLYSLNVTNVWQNTVPTKFVYTVFSATQKRLLSIGQCRALCDLFQAQYDLVRAAWEVYNVQDDTFDFIDTLKRIVRDLTFQDDGNVNLSMNKNDDGATATATENDNEEKDEDYETGPGDIVEVMKQTENRAKEAREAKSNALAAVAEAKRELLKHSLEIMVKQGLVTTQAASNLYERALKGDPLTDAAIEGYAGDRNIMEFLDTLQILANNTPEDLEQMLRSAVENSTQEDDEDQDDEILEVPTEDAEEVVDEEDNQDEEEDDNDGFDEAQRELKSFAKEMLNRGDLDRESFAALLEMIASNDDRILAAHDVYRWVH
jgi:hypothetical protein